MHERFTDRARNVMKCACEEAQRFNHEYIGTEHILLGLVKDGSGVAANVLLNLDVKLDRLRQEVEKVVLAGPDTVSMGKLPQTPRAKKVIEYAAEEARNLNHNYVGTEHLLLGLIREREGLAAQILMNLGLTLAAIRNEILDLLGHAVADEPLHAVKPAEKPELPPRIGEAVQRIEALIVQLEQMAIDAHKRQDFEWGAKLIAQEDALHKMREILIRERNRDQQC